MLIDELLCLGSERSRLGTDPQLNRVPTSFSRTSPHALGVRCRGFGALGSFKPLGLYGFKVLVFKGAGNFGFGGLGLEG